MSDSNPSAENPAGSSSTSSSAELAELKEICADLRWQAHTLRVALLIVATLLGGYFFLEGRRGSQALTSLRPQAAQVIELSRNQDPAVNQLVGQLLEFSKSHADFAAILNKYGIRGTSAPPTTATTPAVASPKTTTPAPATPKK